MDINNVDMLVRREIEGLIVAPLIKAFTEEIGKEKTLAVVQKVIADLALKSGKDLAAKLGGNSLEDLMGKVLPLFDKDGSLEYELLENTSNSAALNITRCKYAEMYRKHGLQEFGFHMSCARDSYSFEGFNPEIEFTRTQTIMEDAKFCDFRFKLNN